MTVQTFPLSSSGYFPGHGWRPLRLTTPMQKGWDVYDLQTKLNLVLAQNLAEDGWFGTFTHIAVRDLQAANHLVVDGIAGAATQVTVGNLAAKRSKYPLRALGQMQKESSMLAGIYTPVYANGSQDTGPLQMNTFYHRDLGANFHVATSLVTWEQNTKFYADKYVRWGLPIDLAWAYAQGAWNSPVYADAAAHGQNPPQSWRDYVAAVTAYV